MIDDLKTLHAMVWKFRTSHGEFFKTPDTLRSLHFAMTELAEALDAEIRAADEGFNRNRSKRIDRDRELSQAMMMLLTAVDPTSALFGLVDPTLRRATISKVMMSTAEAATWFETHGEDCEMWEVEAIKAVKSLYPLYGDHVARMREVLDEIYTKRVAPIVELESRTPLTRQL